MFIKFFFSITYIKNYILYNWFFSILEKFTVLNSDRLRWNVFKGLVTHFKKKNGGRSKAVALWRMPHGQARRPSAAPPSTNPRSSIGDTGRHRRLLWSSLHFRVRACVKVSLVIISFFLLSWTTIVRSFLIGTTSKRMFPIVTFPCSFTIILLYLPFLSRWNISFTSVFNKLSHWVFLLIY